VVDCNNLALKRLAEERVIGTEVFVAFLNALGLTPQERARVIGAARHDSMLMFIRID
jgi:hypothetical protein